MFLPPVIRFGACPARPFREISEPPPPPQAPGRQEQRVQQKPTWGRLANHVGTCPHDCKHVGSCPHDCGKSRKPIAFHAHIASSLVRLLNAITRGTSNRATIRPSRLCCVSTDVPLERSVNCFRAVTETPPCEVVQTLPSSVTQPSLSISQPFRRTMKVRTTRLPSNSSDRQLHHSPPFILDHASSCF